MSRLNTSISVGFIIYWLCFQAFSAFAVDRLNPTIINGNVILCPGEQETLSTQQYDTYQWYKDGNMIPGAIFQTHVVTYYADAGSNFNVFVTQGSESAMSPSILVDGWVFLPLTVSNSGQGYWFTPGTGWEMCEYHSLFFQVMMPYNTNIQWFRDNVPIPGANGNIYQVDQTGVYTVRAAPATCPNYLQYSVPLPVVIHVPPTPIITQVADTLFTSVFPGQWYEGENLIPGVTGQFYIPESFGWYSFEITDTHGCKKMSEAFYYEWYPVGFCEPTRDAKPMIGFSGNSLLIDIGSEYNYEIFSISGLLQTRGVQSNSKIDIPQLKPGLYLIRIRTDYDSYVIKFVK